MRNYNYNPKEVILTSAKEIALEEGINKVNIRSVAKKSNISIGTVYNYYATKADLLVAIIEDFWAEGFKQIEFRNLNDKDFYGKIEELYNNLYVYLHKYKENWLEQISLLSTQEKKLGRKKENEYFSRVHKMIISFMDSDESINEEVWRNGISKEKTAEFVFDNMLLMLRKDKPNIDFFISILKKIMSR